MRTKVYFNSVKQYAVIEARFARKQNVATEVLVKLNPAFYAAKGELITIVGRC